MDRPVSSLAGTLTIMAAMVIVLFCCLGWIKNEAEERCSDLGAKPVSTSAQGTYICVDSEGRIVG